MKHHVYFNENTMYDATWCQISDSRRLEGEQYS